MLLKIGINIVNLTGDMYLSNYSDQAIKFYEEAKSLNPDSFEPHLRIVK